MPYTARQISRIIGDGATRVIPKAAPLTLSQRVSESEVRRRVYSYEDAAAKDTLTLFLKAWGDIRNHSNALAEYGDIRKLSPGSAASAEWKKRLSFYIGDHLETLLNDVAYMVINRVPTAYRAGYYGRAWSMDVSTKPDVYVRMERFDSRSTQNAFATNWLKRTQEPFFESFALIAAKYTQKARQALNTAIINGESVTDANHRVMTLMGLNYETPGKRSLKQAYFEAQSLVRFAVMSASNLGAMRLYAENVTTREAVGGFGFAVIFLTAGDGRVCPTCRQYAGRIFRIDSLLGAALALAVEPPLHGGCRCGEVIIIAPEWLLPEDMPPGLTWAEWLLLQNITELADFMGEGLESTQVGELGYADF